MIYTSYFANLKNVKNPIAICGKSPEWYMGPQYKKLAPKLWFFEAWKEKKISNEEYIECFNLEVLQELDFEKVIKELTDIYHDDEFTLICYEKPGDFCHRHLVANWLKEKGYEVKEHE